MNQENGVMALKVVKDRFEMSLKMTMTKDQPPQSAKDRTNRYRNAQRRNFRRVRQMKIEEIMTIQEEIKIEVRTRESTELAKGKMKDQDRIETKDIGNRLQVCFRKKCHKNSRDI